MRINLIPAILVMLALAAPVWAGQHGQSHAGGMQHRASASAPRFQAAPRGGQGFSGRNSAPVTRNASPAGRSAAPVIRNAAPAGRGAFVATPQTHVALGAPSQGTSQAQVSRGPAVPRQIIRGEGPHNGDWLRNTMRLPPQEQQRALEQDQHFRQLPQQRQDQLRSRLQTFSSMPPQQQQKVLNRMEMMEHLRPEQQRQAQALFGQFRAMDPQRKDMMRRTLREMRTMPPEARERLLNSPEVQSRYSGQEIQMLRGFNGIGFVGPD